MQTLSETGFLLAMFLPSAAVVAGVLALVLTPRRSRPVETPARRAA
jgi:hypothetical protein